MYRKCGKRVIDIILSLLALPIVGFVIIVVGICIFIFDGKPIFYNSSRRGKNGKIYKMYKFRTMKVNAPDLRNSDGSTFNSNNDVRVTKTGRLLRKLSIDEIPQILNVLIGDMSFIGPRPNLPSKRYSEMTKSEKKRLSVRPGITGYSQAYFRNSISQDEKYKNDLYYINHLSLRLDIKIFFKTIESVLRQKNIYVVKDEK